MSVAPPSCSTPCWSSASTGWVWWTALIRAAPSPHPAEEAMSSLLVGSGLAWRAQRPFVEIVWWLVLAGALALLWSIGPDRRELSVLCGVAVAAFGVRVFIGHGGPRVTVLGLMSYAVSMFVGVAGVYAALDRSSRASVEFLTPAILAGLVLSILT